jgi:shikimate kinase
MAAISLPPPCVILRNGFPGVGKYTIAKELQSKIRAPTALIDNHMLIDPVEATEPGRTPAHYNRRREFRRQEFDKLKRLEGETLAIIMTACLAATDSDVEQFMEYADIARARGAR